jgi:hypothetical protein
MMAEVENVVDDHLRHMRGQLDRMEHRLEDITARLGHVDVPWLTIPYNSQRSI